MQYAQGQPMQYAQGQPMMQDNPYGYQNNQAPQENPYANAAYPMGANPALEQKIED